MANRFVGLDPTWAHLPAPTPIPAGHCHSTSSLLFPAAAFENEALTSALRASMSPAAAAASSSYPCTPATPSSSSTSSASELLSGGHVDAPAPASMAGRPPAREAPAGPKGGRVTKRKARPTCRPAPTYIITDPANFRRMVQEVTGFPVASAGVRVHDFAASEPTASAAPGWPTAAPACALPTLDTSAFLLDHAAVALAPVKEEKSTSGGASPVTAGTSAAAVEEEDDCSLLLNLEAMESCAPAFVSDDFPTLESWGIM